MKRILSLTLILCFILGIFSIIPASAADFTVGDYEYVIKDDGTLEIVKYNGKESVITIPVKANNYNVTSIGKKAFERNMDITKVIIPEGITNLSGYVFYSCYNLTEVSLPDSIKEVGEDCFFLF